jgi:hypothetical protein
MDPTKLFTVIALISLPTVMFGGYSLSNGVRWLVCLLLLFGVLAQSGGMFVHAFTAQEGQWSRGNVMSVTGAGLLAVALLIVAYGVAIT